MTERTVWWCFRCNIAPKDENLILPVPPMHDLCQSTCQRRTIDDTATGIHPEAAGLVPKLAHERDIVTGAVKAPENKPRPATMADEKKDRSK